MLICPHDANRLCPSCYKEYMDSVKKCYYCDGVDGNHNVNCRCYKEKVKMNNYLYVRYTNGKEEYCIHGYLMTTQCRECTKMREEETNAMFMERAKNMRYVWPNLPDVKITKKEANMTREDAKNIMAAHTATNANDSIVDALEELGLLKFDEPEDTVAVIVEVDENYNTTNNWNLYAENLVKKYERVRLELWPEGLVLWVGGKIVWKSWEKTYRKGDEVVIRNTNSDYVLGYIK